MGKSAQYKKLRKLKEGLPALNTYAYTNELISSSEAIKRGIKEVSGLAIDGTEKGFIKIRSKVEVPLNHNRKLKEAYKNNGINGATAYANAAKQYALNSLENE
jgi:hypothetical protein